MEAFSTIIGCTPDALKAATKTASWHHHRNAEIASEAIGKRPVILHLGIKLPGQKPHLKEGTRVNREEHGQLRRMVGTPTLT